MSKKNLLNESQIRKFMKYANISSLADTFISEGYDMSEEEVVAEEEMGAEMAEMDMADGDMPAMDDMDLDADVEAADADDAGVMDSEDEVADFVGELIDVIEKATGVKLSMERADDAADMADEDAAEDAEEAIEDLADEMADEAEAEAAADDAEDAADEAADEDEDEAAEVELDETVTRIAESVMARINDAKAKRASVEQIAENIVNRILNND
jgi:hypothetical protein